MALAPSSETRTGTLISPDGTPHPVTIRGRVERPVGVREDGGLAAVIEFDLEADHMLPVPRRYMIELDAGAITEIDLVFSMELANGRAYFKGMAAPVGSAGEGA